MIVNPKDVPELCTWNEETEGWYCSKCGSLILGHEQIISLSMPPNSAMAGLGFGETTRKTIPYCPKCENEPSDTGHSYYGSEDDPDVQDLEMIRRIGERL